MRRWYPYLVVVGLVALGLYRANGLRWFCDDTFITLRYVENFLEGNGLVYNQGERVEGYTHPLWLGILTFSQWIGADPLAASMNLGLASFAGVLLLFSLISYRLHRTRLAPFLPLTALVLVFHHDFLIWATSGMEAMFYTFLFSLAFFVYFIASVERRTKLLITGTILILAVLTRPDGALVFGLANLFLIGRALLRRLSAKTAIPELLTFNLPFLCLYVPYLLWKLSYYGDIFPNSYYAKSAYSSYYARGFYYLWTYLKAYWSSLLFLLGIPAMAMAYLSRSSGGGTGRVRTLRALFDDARYAGLVFSILGIAVYSVFFIARVGGDFMYARFLVPLIPFIVFATEVSLVEIAGRLKSLPLGMFIILALLVGIVEKSSRDRMLLKKDEGDVATVSLNGIVDERYYYKRVHNIEDDVKLGKYLAPYFKGLDATVLLVGQACLGYYAGFETCIENFGLTDRHIAHLPLEQRSRVGHEKQASFDYLTERGVDFVFKRKQVYPYRMTGYRLCYIEPGDGTRIQAELITYDRDLIKALAERMGKQLLYIDFEKRLDNYIATELPQKDKMDVLRDYAEFTQFYFMHNDDPDREKAFIDTLEGIVRPTFK